MTSTHPVVTGPSSKYAGMYKLGEAPGAMKPHNLESWRIVEAILLAYGTADFWDLSVAVRGHKHGTRSGSNSPQGFIRYCIISGWLARV